MAKKKSNHTGRKAIPINWVDVEKFLIAGSNGVQIAAYIGITEQTLYSRCQAEHKKAFSLYSLEKRQKGNSLLLGKQFQVALGGNVSMLIWLGKQRLDQADQPKEKQEFNGNLASLLEVMHLIKTSEDFEALVKLANEIPKPSKTNSKVEQIA